MAVKSFRPITPALRFKTVSSFEEITESRPEKSLIESNKKSGGRNNCRKAIRPSPLALTNFSGRNLLAVEQNNDLNQRPEPNSLNPITAISSKVNSKIKGSCQRSSKGRLNNKISSTEVPSVRRSTANAIRVGGAGILQFCLSSQERTASPLLPGVAVKA